MPAIRCRASSPDRPMRPAIEPVAVSTPHVMQGLEGTARLSPPRLWHHGEACSSSPRLTGSSASSPPERMHIPALDAARFSAPGAASDARGEGARLGASDPADDHRGARSGPLGGRRIEVDAVEGRPPKDDRRARRRRKHVPVLPRGLGPDRSVRGIRVLVPRLAGRRGLSQLRAAGGGERYQTTRALPRWTTAANDAA